MAIPVLYIHHSGIFGGASRSLLELIGGFPQGAVTARLVTQRGAVAGLARAAGIDVIEAAGIAQLDHSRFGYYRGRRWLLLLREAAYILPTLFALLHAKRRWPDTALVHVNELTLLPVIWMARRLFRCPLVIHARSVQHIAGRRRQWVERELARAAAAIAIDETVRRSLPERLAVDVVHNGLSVSPATHVARPHGSPVRVGMVGNLLALKGVHEFIAAARLCKDRGLNVRFMFFGGNARNIGSWRDRVLRLAGFAQDVEGDLKRRVFALGISDIVEFRGFNADLNEIYRAMDVLCFPSMLDAPGRPVFEAAFWFVPSIVALREPLPDTLVPGETGIAIDTATPEAIADAIAHFCMSPQDIQRMGIHARALAERNFDSRRNAARVLDIYRRALQASPGSHA